MGKNLFGISVAALVVAFVAGWAISPSKARIAGATGQIDTFKLMTTGKQLPSEHFADYSFVFN
jgi:hypothetical protein